jgi:hypothetical protein
MNIVLKTENIAIIAKIIIPSTYLIKNLKLRDIKENKKS